MRKKMRRRGGKSFKFQFFQQVAPPQRRLTVTTKPRKINEYSLMGGIVAKSGTSKSEKRGKEQEIVVERRPPLTLANEVLGSQEARKRIASAVEKVSPGETNRWNALLNVVNTNAEPTEDDPDPLRLAMELHELKKYLYTTYETISSASSDGIILMREHYDQIYSNHSLQKNKRLSQIYRNEKKIVDEMFAYAELNHEVFATIFEKVTKAYGIRSKGIFYDIGCGVGQLVYAAAFIGNFSECRGIEAITPLLEVGERKGKVWNQLKSSFPDHIKTVKLVWENENFLLDDRWINGTFLLLHWTALAPSNRKHMCSLMDYCQEGTMTVSFTHAVVHEDFEMLVKDTCRVSWGEVDFFVQIKNKPAKIRTSAGNKQQRK
jgi:hypothetical protein